MKFALIALVASTSAIKVQGTNCVDPKEAKAIFNAIDTNDNHQVGKKELFHAIKAFTKSRNYKPSKEDWTWVKTNAKDTAGDDNTLSETEFAEWVNRFALHFHIDGCK